MMRSLEYEEIAHFKKTGPLTEVAQIIDPNNIVKEKLKELHNDLAEADLNEYVITNYDPNSIIGKVSV